MTKIQYEIILVNVTCTADRRQLEEVRCCPTSTGKGLTRTEGKNDCHQVM